MRKSEQIVAAVSIFASGLILGYFIDREPIVPQEPIREARTYLIGDCQVRVDTNNVLLGIECKEVLISRSSINVNR